METGSFDFSKIFNQQLISVEDSIGRVIGGFVGSKTSIEQDAQTGIDKEVPWYQNILQGIASGFTQTPGGQAVVTTAAQKTMTDTIKAWAASPVVWAGVIVIFLIILFKRR